MGLAIQTPFQLVNFLTSAVTLEPRLTLTIKYHVVHTTEY